MMSPHIEVGTLQQTLSSRQSLKDVPIFQLPFMVKGQDEAFFFQAVYTKQICKSRGKHHLVLGVLASKSF